MRWSGVLFLVSVALIIAGYAIERLWKHRYRSENEGGVSGQPGDVRAMKRFAKDLASGSEQAQRLKERLRTRGERIERARSGPAPTAAELPSLVEHLFDPDADVHDPAEIRLRKAGLAAAAALVAALKDKRIAACLATTRESATQDDAFDRIALLLWQAKYRALGEHIGHLVAHAEWRVFNMAIKSRAALGRGADIGWALSLLNDTSHAEAAMRAEKLTEGLDRAIAEGWAEPALVEALLDWARQDVLPQSSAPDTRPRARPWSIDLLLRHRRDDAIKLLLSDEVLSLNNSRSIHLVLQALPKAGIVLPEAVTRPILDKALAHAKADDHWPWSHSLRGALRAFAASRPQEAIEIAERTWAEGRDDYNCERFLYEIRGLPRSWLIEPPPGMPLSSREREVLEHLSNVTGAQAQIANGGLSQYFFNPSGDNWRRDTSSFLALGLPDLAKALEHAAMVVGHSDGSIAALDRDRRIKQYADLPDDQEQVLDALSEKFWGNGFTRPVYDVMLKHLELFRRVKAARLSAGLDEPDERD